MDGAQTYVVENVKDVVIVSVPAAACSVAKATQWQRELMDKLKKDVIVVSDNVKFFRIETLTESEAAAAFPKGNTVVRVAPAAPAPTEEAPLG